MGGTVRGITRLFGGVPKRRDLGQRSMYVKNGQSPGSSANIVTTAHPRLLGLPRCMSHVLSPFCALPADVHLLAPLRPTTPNPVKGQSQLIPDQ